MAEWHGPFLEYYSKARGYDEQSLVDAHDVLTHLLLGVEVRDRCIARMASNLKRAGTDAKGTLGEAHFSFVLERRRRILLTDAGWKDTPFQVSKGVDLVGVLLPELIVCHIEVKTWGATTDADVRAAFKAMTHERTTTTGSGKRVRIEPAQLGLGRLRPRYEDSASTGHRAAVTTRLLEILHGAGVPDWLNLDELDRERISQDLPDKLLRIGAVVADFPHPFPDRVDGPIDATSDDPCELMLLGVDELDKRLVELAAYEDSLQDSKSARLKSKLLFSRKQQGKC